MTNGSHLLQKRHPETFELLDQRSIEVDHIPISRLNELEWVNGFLYANIWQTSTIVKLDPRSAQILAYYDVAPLLENLQLDSQHYPTLDVLNGIAHLHDTHFLLSGKLYPLLMEVTLDDSL